MICITGEFRNNRIIFLRDIARWIQGAMEIRVSVLSISSGFIQHDKTVPVGVLSATPVFPNGITFEIMFKYLGTNRERFTLRFI